MVTVCGIPAGIHTALSVGTTQKPGAGKNGHYSLGGINQLIAIVEMQWDDVPCGVIVRVRSDMGSLVVQAVEDSGLSLLRHIIVTITEVRSPGNYIGWPQ